MKRLFIILMLGVALPVFAFDFESRRDEGYTLYFNILDDDEENAVEVTYPVATGSNHWQGHRQPWGELVIPSNVEHEGVTYSVVAIGDRAFSNCHDITAVVLPSTVSEIGAYSFYNCTGIAGELTLGEEIVRVGRSAFYGCSGLTTLVFNAIKCESMGGTRSSTAFGNCRSLVEVKFGAHVTRIPDYSFVGMDALRMELKLPERLEYVGEYAFAYCSKITGELRLPASVRQVGAYAFAQCHALTMIELPLRLERIDQRAFYQCIGVKEVNVKTLTPPQMGADVFGGLKQSVVYNVPCITVDRYKDAPTWKRLRNLRTSYPCKLDLIARPSDPAAGEIIGGGTYEVGTTTKLTVVCNAGYGFRSWSDGNTDNPRPVTVNDTVTYVAIMQPATVLHEVKYVHDTTYMDGRDTIVEYYEIGDVAVPIASQQEVVYNRDKRRIEVPIDKADIISVSLYNDAGQCVMTGLPKHGHVNMRRFPTGAYIVRVSTLYEDIAVRFFHARKR